MILGAKARYAVMAMVDLASRRSSQPVSLSDLAEKQQIPLPYLEQIFAKLRKAELVESTRGPKGGYVLSKSFSDIDIASIVEAVDEPLKMTRCSHEDKQQKGCLASNAQCMTHELWEGLGWHIHSYLSGITLKHVCDNELVK